MTAYIALIHKDPDSDFGVSFPDFPGCVTAGTTLDDARQMAAQALAFHLEGMAADGDAIPAPASLERVMQDAENRGAVAVLIDAPARAARSVRVNVMLPEDVLRAIDAATNNRSRFLADAARDKLAAG